MNIRVQAPWAKRKQQKAKTISSLLGKLYLHKSSPQAARSVARAILHIFFRCVLSTPSLGSYIYQAIPKGGIGSRHHPYASFMWMQTVKE